MEEGRKEGMEGEGRENEGLKEGTEEEMKEGNKEEKNVGKIF